MSTLLVLATITSTSKAVLAWIIAHWPYLMAALPSVSVALTNMPENAGFWAYVKAALNLLSVLEHKDAPGTMKLPLRLGRRPVQAAEKRPPTLPPAPTAEELGSKGTTGIGGDDGTAALILIVGGGLLLSAAFSGPGCVTGGSAHDKAVQVAIDCGEPALKSEVASLLPTVLAILSGSAVDWEAQLDALKKNGESALACAVLEASKSPTLSTTSGPSHAAFYLKSRGYRFK